MPAAFTALAKYANANSLKTCIHCSESQAEVEQIRRGSGIIADRFVERDLLWLQPPPNSTTVKHLHSLSALGPKTLLVHGVQLSASDREIVERTGVSWAHCPKSNAKLGNGVAPLGLLKQCYPDGALKVGLGSDSVASNNTMDLFEEMRFAVLAQRAARRSHEAMNAVEALEMATLGGARALGMDIEIGSIEAGKLADIIAVRTDNLPNQPCFDPINALVYAGSARDVCMTMIGGEIVYDGGGFTQIDIHAARDRFQIAANKLRIWPKTN
jgi:5-methylthioadenosine/S-adenosylhomocysteine deaminase